MRRFIIAGALAALALVTGSATAQQVTLGNLSGNECWQVGEGPGGPGAYLCVNVVRGGHAQVTQTVTGNMTIGGVIEDGGNLLVTAQPSAAVITLPPDPPDGAIIGVCNVTGAAWATNAVTLSANTGQTLSQAATLTTLAAGTCAREQFNFSNLTWYRVQ